MSKRISEDEIKKEKYGRLKPIEVVGKDKNGFVLWKCRCDCGNDIIARQNALRSRNTKSCGCLQRERAKESNSKNLTGKRFGNLAVIEKAEEYKGIKYLKSMWMCKCDCGKTIKVRGGSLTSGRTKSCGCLKLEKVTETHTKHGKSNERLYNIWRGMKQRCYYKKHVEYQNYGGRGIKVCEEWKDDFQAFYEWSMANGYEDDLTIDRKDNDKGYSPYNCKWATNKEQSNNKRDVKKYEYKGELHTLPEWADITGIDYYLLKSRVLNYGYSIKEAIETPKYKRIK